MFLVLRSVQSVTLNELFKLLYNQITIHFSRRGYVDPFIWKTFKGKNVSNEIYHLFYTVEHTDHMASWPDFSIHSNFTF